MLSIKNRNGMSNLMENVMYILILGAFIAMIALFLWSRSNSAYIWEDFYAKELARIVNSGSNGDSYRLDVHQGTSIAKRNGLNVQEPSNMFIFNAQKKEICVKLSKGEGKCHPYFSELLVTGQKMELGVPTNFLSFELSSGSKDE